MYGIAINFQVVDSTSSYRKTNMAKVWANTVPATSIIGRVIKNKGNHTPKITFSFLFSLSDSMKRGGLAAGGFENYAKIGVLGRRLEVLLTL